MVAVTPLTLLRPPGPLFSASRPRMASSLEWRACCVWPPASAARSAAQRCVGLGGGD